MRSTSSVPPGTKSSPTASQTELVGRNVIEGRWTFQIVEEYDDDYYALFKQLESEARTALVGGRRHLFESEMKEDRRTHGLAHHEAVPGGPAAAVGPPRTPRRSPHTAFTGS